MEAGDLAPEIQLGITRVTTVFWCHNSIHAREFLSKQLVGVRQDQEQVVLGVEPISGEAAQVWFPRFGYDTRCVASS